MLNIYKLVLVFIHVMLTNGNQTIPWVTRPFHCIEKNAVCANSFNNVLKVFQNIPSAELCGRMCQVTENCEFFNFFPDSVNPLLRHQCHLLNSCQNRRESGRGPDGKVQSGPFGPMLGRKDCSSTDCILDYPRGGQWFWFESSGPKQAKEVTLVRDSTRVLYFCGDKPLEVSHCSSGEMKPLEKVFDCPCKSIQELEGVQCTNGESNGEMEGGTRCSKTCGDEVIETSFCENGNWTADLSEVDCFERLNSEASPTWTWLIIMVIAVLILFCIVITIWNLSKTL